MDGVIRRGRGVYFFAVRVGRVLDSSLGGPEGGCAAKCATVEKMSLRTAEGGDADG
jgi:hypothetical protein